jgi:hypothetical protein
MAELYFKHETIPYIFDTKSLKLYRLERNRSVEIDNPETAYNVRFHSAEISREKALKMVDGYRH